MKKISYAQLEKYENDGYVVVENVLDEKLWKIWRVWTLIFQGSASYCTTRKPQILGAFVVLGGMKALLNSYFTF